ncbi:MAG: hypothetical protein KME54_11585 [Tolypothrix brevis GSE-NOS-MK-07-07A]|jgi:hypothetical protein|nr:hypothetical protein [Tolypothrix brevis GSE-NOS-MK-07-07A]
MPKFDPAKLKKVSVSLPFGIGSAEWESLRKDLEQYGNALAEFVGV